MRFSLILLIIVLIVLTVVLICHNTFNKKQVPRLYNILTNQINMSDVYNKIQYPIYFINMDKNVERRQFMEDQFKKCNITNYTRIPGVDVDNFKYKVVTDYDLTKKQKGCIAAHVMAMIEFLKSDYDIAIILEDDADFSIIPSINFRLKDFIENRVPNDWEIVSLFNLLCNDSNNGEYDKNIKLYERKNKHEPCWSTVAYIINKKAAKKFINTVFKNDTIYINKTASNFPDYGVADDYIYALLKTYYITPSIIFPYNPDEEDSDYLIDIMTSYINKGVPQLNDNFKIIQI